MEVAGHSVTIWAQRGSQYVDAITGSRFMLLRIGRRYEGVIGRTPYRVVKFETLGQRIEQRDPDLDAIEIDAQPTGQLRRDDPALGRRVALAVGAAADDVDCGSDRLRACASATRAKVVLRGSYPRCSRSSATTWCC